MAINPPVTVTAPTTSAVPRSAGGRAGISHSTRATSTTPMGTLTRNTHSQPGPVVSTPLTITPNDAALPDTAPKTPSALVRAGRRAAGQGEPAERQAVGDDDPLEVGLAQAQLGLDRGDGHVHDRQVEDDHELRSAHQRQHHHRRDGPT